VTALIVPHDRRRGVDEAELVAFARDRLAGYKLPRVIELVDELPRTPSGKVLKRELRDQLRGYRSVNDS
jgi:long-chain acyl-CoA synthetase